MISAIIQARMGSTRLPHKVMLKLAGQPMIGHVIARAQAATQIQQIILATTTQAEDDPLAEWAESQGVGVFRGDEKDVLDRYYQAAQAHQASIIVRLTGDCPVLDARVIDQTIQLFRSGEYDYASNFLQRSYPDGLDTEVMTFEALEKAWEKAKLPSEREHVTPYIYKHPEEFKLIGLVQGQNLSHQRWTVDEKRDFELMSHVFEALYPQNPLFGMPTLAAFLAQNPQLSRLNADIPTNEGYAKSLEADNPQQAIMSLQDLRELLHEIRNPLSGIRAAASLLTRYEEGNLDINSDQRRQLFQILERQSNTLETALLDRSEYYRLRAGQVLFRPSRIQPQVALDNMRQYIEHRIQDQNRQLTVQMRLPESAPALHTDRLSSILMRLADNAIKFTPDGGKIDLATWYDGDSHAMIFAITDTGIGIPAEHHHHIFEPYFVGTEYHGSLVAQRGSGLGLTLAQGYVHKMGGEIWFTSVPQEGSSFYIRIPLEAAAEPLENDERPTDLTPSRLKRQTLTLPVMFKPAAFYEEVREFVHDALLPLTAVRGYADLLLKELDGKMPLTPEERRHFLTVIKTNGTTLAAYILNMGEIVRFEKNPVLELTKVRLGEVMEKISEDLSKKGDARRKKMDVRFELPADIMPIWGDRDRIHRILQRLLDNALLYTPDGGSIILSAWNEPEHKAVIISVSDTGVGIAPDDYEIVFKRYERGNLPDSLGMVGGSGMGLSIAKMYVEAHGGKIWFESEQGLGSSFYVQLPTYEI